MVKKSMLHSKIVLVMRRKGLSMELMGGDLIRGVVFGMIDHPEYELDTAVKRAVEMCNLPGYIDSIETAYSLIYECIDAGNLRVEDEYQVDGSRRTEREITHMVVNGLVKDVRKSEMYAQTVKYLTEHEKLDIMQFSTELIKNMVYKIIMSDRMATEECTLTYAYKKAYMDEEQHDYNEMSKKVIRATMEIVPGSRTPYEYAMELADNIMAESIENE